MRFTSRLLSALGCLLIGAGGIATAAPVTDVVFGNLGPDGAGNISSTTTDIGPGAPSIVALAQGFTTGSSSTNLSVKSITIGAFATSEGTVPRTISIYSSSSNNPGSVLFTSAATNVGNTGKYTFNFSGANLTAATQYWIVPDFSVNWSWYLEADESTQPSEQNASGYSYLGTRRQTETNPGVWGNSLLPYSVSVEAVPVPEPSTYALAALGLGAAGIVRARRRKSAV
jgi:hypothetical protein